jgi:hypothetical protein
MAVDGCFKIAGEAAVQSDRGAMLSGHAERFGEPPQRTLSGNSQHNGGRGFLLDDDLVTCTHAGQQAGEVARRFRFRDADHSHTRDDTLDRLQAEARTYPPYNRS